jgi:HAD superfamily hydrolase (TIGR01509 family)
VRAFGVGFDIDHTICIDNRLERVAMLHLLHRIVSEGGHFREGIGREIDEIDALLSRQREGACTIEEAVTLYAGDHGVADPQEYVEMFRETALRMVDTFVVPDPYAGQVLNQLAGEGVRVAILSNGWNPLQTAKAKRSGFDVPVLASAQLGVQKPDPEAFAALAKTLGVELDCCVYVGDDPHTDAAGAIGAGMQAVWLDSEGKTYPANLPQPTRVVHALRDVPAVIRSAVFS